MTLLSETIAGIRPPDEAAMAQARARQDQLTKPAGSLGRLEALSIQIAGITGQARPRLPRKAVMTFAGDHGVVAQGVSLYPQAVTQQMVRNFLDGGAAINALARVAGARVVVADLGVAGDLGALPQPRDEQIRFVVAKIAAGTRDLATGPAMTRTEAVRAIETGIRLVNDEWDRGLDVVGLGEMGIGNTTPSSCLTAALTGAGVDVVTGRGTGIGDTQLAQKRAIVEQALAVNQPDRTDALDVLTKVGGLEIAGLAGVVLGGAARRVVVVVDGFIAGAAALVAARLAPAAAPYLIAAHRSVEPGHQVILRAIGLEPLLDLGLRLGEGTGAALAFPLLDAACAVLDEMATFADAGVSGKQEQ
jgi:nicotinate-nucleotide--dimethylbenzimidazole phosphoribosyltransferase